MSVIPISPVLFLIKCIIFFILLFTLTTCFSKKNEWSALPSGQRYVDQTRKYFPKGIKNLNFGRFVRINRDPFSDLILIQEKRKSKAQILAYILNREKKYQSNIKNGLNRDFQMDIQFFASGDLNQDRNTDLILLGHSKIKNRTRFLINNKKGYFYFSRNSLPFIKKGVKGVEIRDIDQDGDRDLLFFGQVLREDNGDPAQNNAQLIINQGKGKFIDASSLLLPSLLKGMVAVSIADYDGDDVLDIFWVNSSGRNALWINNGLGKFSDYSNRSLPFIPAQYAFADWADFDMDGDNDLLLVASKIPKKFRSYENEFCFFLENDGRGIFKKRSLELLPMVPSYRVYLLDADANGVPDILILSRQGVHFLVGQGPWKFSDETIKRLPFSARFDEMTFGDVNGDGNLDIFGILSKNRTGRIWVDRLN